LFLDHLGCLFLLLWEEGCSRLLDLELTPINHRNNSLEGAFLSDQIEGSHLLRRISKQTSISIGSQGLAIQLILENLRSILMFSFLLIQILHIVHTLMRSMISTLQGLYIKHTQPLQTKTSQYSLCKSKHSLLELSPIHRWPLSKSEVNYDKFYRRSSH
jgi:hypothetical protein